MRFICENGHIFEHVAKLTRMTFNKDQPDENLEIPVCPICTTRIYSEYVLDKKQITSVISVNLDEVDSKLKEGYEVESLYAKTATLVKRS